MKSSSETTKLYFDQVYLNSIKGISLTNINIPDIDSFKTYLAIRKNTKLYRLINNCCLLLEKGMSFKDSIYVYVEEIKKELFIFDKELLLEDYVYNESWFLNACVKVFYDNKFEFWLDQCDYFLSNINEYGIAFNKFIIAFMNLQKHEKILSNKSILLLVKYYKETSDENKFFIERELFNKMPEIYNHLLFDPYFVTCQAITYYIDQSLLSNATNLLFIVKLLSSDIVNAYNRVFMSNLVNQMFKVHTEDEILNFVIDNHVILLNNNSIAPRYFLLKLLNVCGNGFLEGLEDYFHKIKFQNSETKELYKILNLTISGLGKNNYIRKHKKKRAFPLFLKRSIEKNVDKVCVNKDDVIENIMIKVDLANCNVDLTLLITEVMNLKIKIFNKMNLDKKIITNQIVGLLNLNLASIDYLDKNNEEKIVEQLLKLKNVFLSEMDDEIITMKDKIFIREQTIDELLKSM